MFLNRAFNVLFFILLLSLIKDIRFNIGPKIYLSELVMFLLLILNHNKSAFLKNNNFSLLKVSRRFKRIFIFLLFYYVIIMLFSLIDGADYKAVLGRFRNLYFAPLLFFLGLHFFSSLKDIKKVFKIFNIFFIIAFVVGILNLTSPISFLQKIDFEQESYTMIINQEIGSFVMMIVMYSLLRLFFKIGGLLDYALLLIAIVSVIGSQNRSLILLFAVSILMVLMILLTHKKITFQTIFITIITFVSFYFIIENITETEFTEKYMKRYTIMADEVSGVRSFENSQLMLRIGRTLATFENVLEHPFFGPGWEYKLYKLKIYDFNGKHLKTAYGTPHNYFINQLLQTGLVGLFFMLRIFYLVFKFIKPKVKISKNSITEYSLYFTFILLLVFNFFNVYLYGTPAYIGVTFFLFGLSVSYSTLKNEAQFYNK